MDNEKINIEYLKSIGMDQAVYKQINLDCEICERDDFTPILCKGKIGKTGQYGPINIVQCNHCGHVMVNPRFEKQFYIDFYKEFYKDNVAYLGDGKPQEELIDRQKERAGRCETYLSNNFNITPGRMLDLGCAYGATMIPFMDKGWDVRGIDPEEASVEFGKKELGVSVDYGFAEELPYPDDSFDLVISLGALEHVHDFPAAMKELQRTVNFGGYLFIRMRHNRPWGNIWEYYNRNHYRFFSGHTHKLAVIRYGFEVVEYTDQQIEGRTGDRYLLCRNVAQPSLENVELAIANGMCDTPEKLCSYLREHNEEQKKRVSGLLELERECKGSLLKMYDEINSGRFSYPLLYCCVGPEDAVSRALVEARAFLRECEDDGIMLE